MMRQIFSVLIVTGFTFGHYVRAQQIFLDLKFNNALEISSLVFQSDKIVLLTEKCKQLYFLDNSGKVVDEQFIDNGHIKNREVGIEAAAWFKGGLLLADEKEGEVLYLNMTSGLVSKVDTDFDMSADIQGLEGIAVDSVRGLSYLVKEKNGNGESLVRVFKIEDGLGIPSLKFVKNVRVRLLNNDWRLADVTYNPADDQLYFLETKKRGYRVVNVKSADLEKATGENLINPILHKDLSGFINEFEKKGFNTNMEGLAIMDGSIYVVSDNANTSSCSSSILGKGKTLLIKVPF